MRPRPIFSWIALAGVIGAAACGAARTASSAYLDDFPQCWRFSIADLANARDSIPPEPIRLHRDGTASWYINPAFSRVEDPNNLGLLTWRDEDLNRVVSISTAFWGRRYSIQVSQGSPASAQFNSYSDVSPFERAHLLIAELFPCSEAEWYPVPRRRLSP